MRVSDLEYFPPNGHPSPYGSPVLIVREDKLGYGLLSSGVTLRAVGWLGSWNFTRGVTDEKCIDRLFEAYPTKIISDGTMGWHTCEICFGKEPDDSSLFFILHLVWYGLRETFNKFREIVFDKKPKDSASLARPQFSGVGGNYSFMGTGIIWLNMKKRSICVPR